ncbi:MAG: hypothetical protein ACYDHH_07655 [Solirubrobacteraceae bacterium]
MTVRRAGPIAIVSVCAALAGCGSSGHRIPSLKALPLVGGSNVVAQARMCNPGANAYCQVELVVTNGRFASSEEFLNVERAVLHKLGWTGQYAPNGNEHSDDSPGHALRVIFATAYGDLVGIDFGWIKRSHSIALALAHANLARQATLSMVLQLGAS